jgi:RadC-like JAB domain
MYSAVTCATCPAGTAVELVERRLSALSTARPHSRCVLKGGTANRDPRCNTPSAFPFATPRPNYRAQLEDLPVEEFHVGVLDAKHRLHRDLTISRGLLDSCQVVPREVFREVIHGRAAAIVLAHNHPSGDPSPSPEDANMTGQLVHAGRLLGPALDHVIIGRGFYFSFWEAGRL